MALPASPRNARAGSRGQALARHYDRAARGAAATRRRLDQGLEVLRRLVPLAGKLSRVVGVYVAVVFAAALTIIAMLVWRFWPSSLTDVVVHVALAGLLLTPPAMLWLFHKALAEVVQLPARLSATPEVARAHGTELAALVRASQERHRGRVRLTALPGDLWRAGRLLLAAHDDLPGYGAVLALVRLPFLFAALGAAAVGFVEILLAPAVVAGAVLTSAL